MCLQGVEWAGQGTLCEETVGVVMPVEDTGGGVNSRPNTRASVLQKGGLPCELGEQAARHEAMAGHLPIALGAS